MSQADDAVRLGKDVTKQKKGKDAHEHHGGWKETVKYIWIFLGILFLLWFLVWVAIHGTNLWAGRRGNIRVSQKVFTQIQYGGSYRQYHFRAASERSSFQFDDYTDRCVVKTFTDTRDVYVMGIKGKVMVTDPGGKQQTQQAGEKVEAANGEWKWCAKNRQAVAIEVHPTITTDDLTAGCAEKTFTTYEEANFEAYVLGVKGEVTVFPPQGKKYTLQAGERTNTHYGPSPTPWRWCAKNKKATGIDIQPAAEK